LRENIKKEESTEETEYIYGIVFLFEVRRLYKETLAAAGGLIKVFDFISR